MKSWKETLRESGEASCIPFYDDGRNARRIEKKEIKKENEKLRKEKIALRKRLAGVK